MYLEITLISYCIDMIFGEFDKVKFYKHPVIFMGDFIKWFENNFYANSIVRGYYLVASLLFIVIFIAFIITYFFPIWLIGIIASVTISSKMLYDKVEDIIQNPSNIKYLVSRDTSNLSQSDINKAAIETYAENLSDGVIAPIFYLIFFGLYGVFIYKAVNTLDSMVGYRGARYEKFGKVSAILDDILNFIPSKITALLIATLMLNKKSFVNIFKYGYLHESPNAGFPISAMAGVCDISLGGDTSYFGKMVKKPYFGDGTKEIAINHIKKALTFNIRLDIFIIIYLGVLVVISKLV